MGWADASVGAIVCSLEGWREGRPRKKQLLVQCDVSPDSLDVFLEVWVERTQVWVVVEWKAADPEAPSRRAVLVPLLSFLIPLLVARDLKPLHVAR